MDGKTNGQELGDPDCVWKQGDAPAGDATGHPGTVYTTVFSAGTSLRNTTAVLGMIYYRYSVKTPNIF